MMATGVQFAVGACAAALVAAGAAKTGSLTRSGAVAAWFVGTATFGALGIGGAAVLFVFFFSSIGLSKFGRERKRRALADVAKTGSRDAAQVLANGGIAAVCALAALWIDHRFAAAFAGALCAATADTWGTEIGALAPSRPVSIVTLRPIATGLSGGVSAIGTAAELAGAATIAAVTALASLASWPAVAAAGAIGAFADSLLGATVQTLRRCATCNVFCESDPHHCGAQTHVVRGLPWFGNDTVNTAATLCGAIAGFAFGR